MKTMFKSFAKKIFGVNYERLVKNILICLIVFYGLYIADYKMSIAPFILYLMSGVFTAGVMWQALSSEDNASNMMNLFMLPFDNRKLIFSYVCALGTYTLFTKTGILLAVVFAISSWSVTEIVGSILCAINAVIMTACVYSLKRLRIIVLPWAGIIIATIYLTSDSNLFLPLLVGNLLFSVIFLQGTNAYSFYRKADNKQHNLRRTHGHSIMRYLFRYLMSHKNYLVNTVVMWGMACILPMFFKQMDNQFVLPVGFAILSLNTPICILLSCNPSLEQAVRFLPRQKRAFCIPYCVFIFLCNITVDLIFLCSFEIQIGGITISVILTAFFFALQSAICSVLLEWFYPIRGWSIESDLWHHPRKYVVPVSMLLLAGIVGTLPWLVYILFGALLVECIVLLVQCKRC